MSPIFVRGAGVLGAVVLLAASANAAGMLAAKNDMTLYVFDKDKGGLPSCYDTCATEWPPYVGKTGEKLGEGWSLVKRKGDEMQWAYDAKPVYFHKGDVKKGDKTGDGMEGIWHVINE
jgi:predicted lipoprotein with Yx(FWY)xxD motif